MIIGFTGAIGGFAPRRPCGANIPGRGSSRDQRLDQIPQRLHLSQGLGVGHGGSGQGPHECVVAVVRVVGEMESAVPDEARLRDFTIRAVRSLLTGARPDSTHAAEMVTKKPTSRPSLTNAKH